MGQGGSVKTLYAIDSARTGWLLSLDKASLRLVIGFIIGPCEVRSQTGIWNRYQLNYCRVCCDEENLETIKHLLCNYPVLSKGRGLFEGLNLCRESISRLFTD